MAQAYYRKWRPQTWDEVVGQDHVVRTLRNAVRAERVAHAYLFAGPRGTGKTTAARLLAKAVNCLDESLEARPCNTCAHCLAVNEARFLDLIEIDAASNTSVEDVRDLRDKIYFSPNEGRYRVYIVDEVHMLSTAAFNALLKTLEEPPGHALFVLATTEVHRIPATVLSRCQRHEFRRLPVAVIVEHLRGQLETEGLQAEPGVLELVARQATGSLRDAISLIDQLASAGGTLTLAGAEAVLGTAAGEAVRGVVEALVGRDIGGGLTQINRALDGGADPRQFARQVVDQLRSLLLARMGNAGLLETTPEARAELERLAQAVDAAFLLEAIRAFNRAAFEARPGWQPGLPLELALVETAGHAAQPDPPPGPAATRVAVPTAKPPPAATDAHDPPPAPRSGGTSRTAAGPTFQMVVERWKEILSAVRRRDPLTQALLNSCQPLGVEAGVLVLGFPSDLLREKMERGHSASLTRDALAEVLGQPLDIRPALRGGSGRSPSRAAAMSGEQGMVATAVRDLGAQIVEVEPAAPDEGPSPA